MTTICIQIQPHKATSLDLAKVKELGEAIASDRALVSRFGIVDGIDGVPYTNLMFDTADAESLWGRIQADLYSSKEVRGALLQASMAMCEGKDGWNDYLLLYHFNENEKLDSLNDR